MRYFFVAGEASGDLHASHLMRSLKASDPEAEFRGFGGDLMQAEGMLLLRHYRELAYMGFMQVLLHLPTILRAMKDCENAIAEWQPHCVVLVDYPGFNLKIAKWVKTHTACPVFYYIAPKIWAWKEGRIRSIRRHVDHLLSILPFEVDYFAQRHHYPVEYVGNPSHDEVSAFLSSYKETREAFFARHGWDDQRELIAVLAGSRRAEIADNLPRMLEAVRRTADPARYRVVLAAAPGIADEEYARYGITVTQVQPFDSEAKNIGAEQGEKNDAEASTPFDAVTSLHHSATVPHTTALKPLTSNTELPICAVRDETYALLAHSHAAIVTSGTATLETALFNVPQVVCYNLFGGKLVRLLRPYFLKCKYISLVNLIADRAVVPELIADDTQPAHLAAHFAPLLEDCPERRAQLSGYEEMRRRLGATGAPEQAAARILSQLRKPLSPQNPNNSI